MRGAARVIDGGAGESTVAREARPSFWIAVLMGTLSVGCLAGKAPKPAVSSSSAARAPSTTSTPVATGTSRSTPAAAGDMTATATEVAPTMTPRPKRAHELVTVTLTIVYDNNPYDPALRTFWGFSCWVETDESTVLFDTGGDGSVLMHNLNVLDLDPQEIDVVVLSHAHGDHTGGLDALLSAGVRPVVYAPVSFPESFKRDVRARTALLEITKPMTVAPGVHTTGEVKSNVTEQALAVETDEGLVVVTGCAHPGVADMVRRAKEATGGEVALLMGGFHLDGASPGKVERVIAELRSLGVRRVAPCHCTGHEARELLIAAFGECGFPAGVGWSTEFIGGK